jgi:hypothetical protein
MGQELARRDRVHPEEQLGEFGSVVSS